MLKPLLILSVLLVPGVFSASAEPAAPAPLALQDAVEVVAEGFKFTEGPAVGPDGAVYFTDIPAQRIMRFDPATGETATFRENSGGANGLFFGKRKRDLYVCEGGRQRVAVFTAWDAADLPRRPSAAYAMESESLVGDVDGVPFNNPNDLTVDTAGGVYFTDPDYGNRPGPKPPFEGVYYRAAGGTLTCLVDDYVRPNGIALHPDGTLLYVHDNGTDRIEVWDVTGPGKVENRRLFADVSDLRKGGKGDKAGKTGLDGLCVDELGRVYSALFQARAVVVHNEAGDRLQVVSTGPQTTNCVIGPVGEYLYVTADKSLKRIPLEPIAWEAVRGSYE